STSPPSERWSPILPVCRVLLALGDGRALPASRLAAEAGVTPATASSHLAKLVAVGLLVVERQGGATASSGCRAPMSADSSRPSPSWPPPSRSGPCARAPGPRPCALPGPATTTSRGA